jgi:hypothetical protein
VSSRRSDIISQAQSELASVFNINSTSMSVGEPVPIPYKPSAYPFVIFRAEQPKSVEQITMGTTGKVAEVYDITIKALLGPSDMTPGRAETAQVDIADKLRACFLPDSTLATLVFDSTLLGGEDNLTTYIERGELPYVTYRLEVTEHIARNAAAG